MLTSLVSLIPKTDDTSPTNLRPITVTSCVYRLWACRRLQDVMEWQEGWVLPTQHGFRSGHRTDDVLMELTTLIEETLLDETKSLYMVALDFAKCFDRVPQGIVLSLAEEMGLDARILRPLRAMYRGMKRRFKLPLGVGSEFEVTNGILQGCPLSVILINALLSVVLRAVSVRVPEVSSESLADDATLLAPAEAELQQAVDIVARFCALTGMRLNMSKTVAMGIRAGSTQQRRRRPYASAVKVGGEAIVTATSAKILGVRTSVESVRASRANDARLSAHDGLIDRLSTSKLPFDVRCEVASSNVLSSVLAGCSYETYTQTRLKGLRTRVVRGAFGSRQPSRSVTAVLSILAKGHRLDPMIARPYRILCSFFDACERLPRVYARMLNIARLYSRHGVLLPEARLGPVGIAISDGFTVAGIGYEGRDFATAALEGRRLLDMERGERHHAIRARLRQTTWTQLARQRPSYNGVQAGVDCRRTNELRLATADAGEKRALAVILSGGVFLAARWGRNARANGGAAGSDGSPSSSASVSSTASDTTGSFDEHASESSSSEPQRPPLDRGCRDCDRGVQDTADHLWWECPAYDEIRGRPCFAELLRADRARWPSCTRVHGVIVEGMRVEVAALHRLMAAVYTARVEAERRRLSAVQPMHPWHAAAPLPAVQHLFNFDRLPDEPPRWPYGGRAMRALKGWLSALRWTDAGEVSCVELAVDFEVHTGVDVPAPPGIRRLAANQRGKTLWTMLSTLCRLCRDLQLPSPLPAERKVRVGSMRTLGAPMLWGGLTPRPRFAGGEETHGVLEASFPRAAAGDGKNWGGDVFPQYDAARRAQRSLRWDVPTPLPQRPRLPVLVPAAQADPLLRTQSVCDACAKQKCAVCTGMRRNYSLVVDQCCQVHHRPDDGLRIQCCRAHRLTRCGTCPNADACCGRGHHRGGAGRDSSSGDGGGGGHGGRGGGDNSGGDGGGGRGTGRGRARGGARGGGRGGGGGGGRGESDGLTGRKRRAPSPPGTPTSRGRRRRTTKSPPKRAPPPAGRKRPAPCTPTTSPAAALRARRRRADLGDDGTGLAGPNTPRPPGPARPSSMAGPDSGPFTDSGSDPPRVRQRSRPPAGSSRLLASSASRRAYRRKRESEDSDSFSDYEIVSNFQEQLQPTRVAPRRKRGKSDPSGVT
ncbi:RNA-directed DNA polymerase from mobile element jockey [Diplonema papillatum]|nr:RNA-directed DNA polymerase from mobile element jockey [Diplonema papillatum]